MSTLLIPRIFVKMSIFVRDFVNNWALGYTYEKRLCTVYQNRRVLHGIEHDGKNKISAVLY